MPSGDLRVAWQARPATLPALMNTKPLANIVILISGRGSNMEAIVRAAQAQAWNARIAAVISNRPDAAGLAFAQSHGIATEVIDHKAYGDRQAFDAALGDAVAAHQPDWVVLAGFMRILTPAFVQRFATRLINIHPSLLPAFPGLHTHQRAIDAGCKIAGATVHFVTAELDHGPILSQAWVPVLEGDTEGALAQRVLAREHIMLPRALRWLVDGHARLEGDRVVYDTPDSPLI